MSNAPAMPEKLPLVSPDLAAERLAALKQIVPEAFNLDGSLNPDKLREALGNEVEIERERFGLNWPGKQEAFRLAQKPTTATLRPAPEESVNWDTTENVFIEGDNLEVLKVLQKAYHGKVKLIYIDPPYNTGKDFVYEDDRAQPLNAYLHRTGQKSDDGFWTTSNAESSGRFHSDWLSMMAPRLMLARNLLRSDGTIFISIDDNEVAQLRKLCDEVFGEENFIATVIWEKVFAPKPAAKTFSTSHDYLLVYARATESWDRRLLPRTAEQNDRYENPDNDPRGPWASDNLLRNEHRDNSVYTITSPSGKQWTPKKGQSWRHPEDEMKRLIAGNEIWFGSDGQGMPRRKKFLSDVQQGLVPETLWRFNEVGHTQDAKRRLIELFGYDVFATPKPPTLIARAAAIATADDDIVLDFFAGTCSTAEAVISMNAVDGQRRRWICIQLPEPTNQSDFPTIAEIGKERIRRVIAEKVKEAGGKLIQDGADLGFRVYKLDASNFADWSEIRQANVHDLLNRLHRHVENTLPDRTEQDILWEILIKTGLPPSTAVETFKVAGQTCYGVAQRQIVVCLEKSIKLETIEAVADLKPTPARFYCLDAAFDGDDARKANAAALFRNRTDESGKQLTEFKFV